MQNNQNIDFVEFNKYVDIFSKAFEKFDIDIINKKNKIEFLFFVDFSEIIGFFFPFEDFRRGYRGQNISMKNDYIRSLNALNIIFDLNEPLYILPPHVVELKKYLSYLNNYRGFNSLFKNELDKEVSSFRTELGKTGLGNHFNSVPTKNEELDLVGTTDLFDFIEQYYSRLKAFRVMVNVEGLSSLKEQFTKKKIQYFEALSEQYNFEVPIESYISKARPWFELFTKIRKSHHDTANYLDALAIVYIDELNKFFKLNNINKIAILITRANGLSHFMDNIIKFELNSYRQSCTRNLEFFILQDLHKFLSEIKRIEIFELLRSDFNNIQKGFKAIAPLVQGYNQKESLNGLSLNILTQKMTNLVKALTSKRDLNYYLMDINKYVANEETIPIKKRKNNLNDFYDQLLNFVNADEDFISRFINWQEDKSTLIRSLTEELSQKVDSLISISNDEISKFKIEKRSKSLKLNGLSGEMPIMLVFRTEGVIEAADKILKIAYDHSLSDVINEINNEKAKHSFNELDLLHSYFEACIGRWQDALDIIEKTIKIIDKDPISEIDRHLLIDFFFLKTFLCRKKELVIDGFKASILGLKIKENDYRILREQGVLIWQAYNGEQRIMKDFFDSFGFVPTRAEAILRVEKALYYYDLNLGKEFQLRCYNSLAYFYAESEKYADIIKAEKYINVIIKLEPSRENLPSRFIDTFGFVKLRKCLIEDSPFNKNEKLNHLNDSIKEFEFALKLGGVIGRELEVIQNNLFTAIKKRDEIDLKEWKLPNNLHV